MTACDLLTNLALSGIELKIVRTLDGVQSISLTGQIERLSDDLKNKLRECKPVVLAYLAQWDSEKRNGESIYVDAKLNTRWLPDSLTGRPEYIWFGDVCHYRLTPDTLGVFCRTIKKKLPRVTDVALIDQMTATIQKLEQICLRMFPPHAFVLANYRADKFRMPTPETPFIIPDWPTQNNLMSMLTPSRN